MTPQDIVCTIGLVLFMAGLFYMAVAVTPGSRSEKGLMVGLGVLVIGTLVMIGGLFIA